MDFNTIILLIVLAFILIALYTEFIGTAFTFIIAVGILGIFNILTPQEILSGFANEQVAIIIMLLLLGEIIRETAVIERAFDAVYKKNKPYKGFMFRIMSTTAFFSAFLNNTPLVAVMMPYVNSWGKKNKVAPSKLLIPLSFAAILGGSTTLIGTSTNLIVNGLVKDQTLFPEFTRLHLFEFAYVGLPMLIIGFAYILFFGYKLLPSKKGERDNLLTNRKYIVEALIRPGSKLIGKTIEEANLRNLDGLFLVEIIRGNIVLPAVSPNTVLLENDLLYFAGETEKIADLVSGNNGLTFPQVGMLKKKIHTQVIEVVISHNSTLINKTVKEARFRSKYDAAIIAIHRNGEKVSGKIGEVKLKAGDVLLLLAGEDIASRADIYDFYFISKVKEMQKIPAYKTAILLTGTVLAIALSALHFISLFNALLILFVVILSIGVVSPKDIHKKIDLNLAGIIALSLALGTAMIKTGVASMLADDIILVSKPLGVVGVFFVLYFITTVLAAFITNKAAVAIMFPIAIATAYNLHVTPVPFALLIAYAAAANFMTPIGYQTNLMIYGPGGYTFKDFFRIGFPLTIIYMIVAVIILYYVYIVKIFGNIP